jgi:hypothetical protein
MIAGTRPADIEVNEDLVRALLTQLHPDLAALPLRHADVGWDNVMYQLGDHLAVRVRRRELGAQCIISEQAWATCPCTQPAPANTRPTAHGSTRLRLSVALERGALARWCACGPSSA